MEAIRRIDMHVLSRALEAAAADEDLGLCLECGADQEGVEPDARRYRFEDCGARAVYGAAEIVLMGT